MSEKCRSGGDDRDEPGRHCVALVPLVLRVEGVGKAEEDVHVLRQGIVLLQSAPRDCDLAKVFVLGRWARELVKELSKTSREVGRTFLSLTVYIIRMNSAHSSVCSR